MQNNIDKQIDIICDKQIVKILGKEIPTANFKLINLEEYIEKEIKIYD